MSIATRIEKVKQAERTLEDHPMCADLMLVGSYYMVVFPNTVGGLDGLHASTCCGKLLALEKLYAACEKAWKDDNSWWLH